MQSLGYSAMAAASGEEALSRVEDERPDLVLTDLRMSGMTGIELSNDGLSAGYHHVPRLQAALQLSSNHNGKVLA